MVTPNVRIKVLLVAPPSSTITVITTKPKELLAAENVSVPVVFGLVYVTVGFGTKAGLLEKALTVNVWFSDADPEVIPVRLIVCGPAFSFKVTSAIGSRVGGTFCTGAV